jgi:hypothetical protein
MLIIVAPSPIRDFPIYDTLLGMKTSLIIPDALYRQLKRRAADRKTTISELVTEYLRKGLAEKPGKKPLLPLPTFDLGRPLVNIADRSALHEAMDRERDERLYGSREATERRVRR